jgi:hypothetical protein
MWIFTNTGFVSAVSNGKELIVRSRDRFSLETISAFAKAEIKKSPVSDYPYRLTINKELFAEWLSKMAKSIDYQNFKSEVADLRGDHFVNPLMRVWSVMHEIEDREARN